MHRPRRFPMKAAVPVVLACCLFMITALPSHAQTAGTGGAAPGDYESGAGQPVGFVHLVEGDVSILSEGSDQGNQAVPDMPLFEGDTIETMDPGRIRIQMKDESIITLTSKTRLTISRSLYNPEKQERASFFDMALGKARFVVKKLVGYKRSEFKVKTRTAVVGVRGSDFTLLATPELTEVTAFENTLLEVIGLIGPEVPPVLLGQFQQTVISLGELPRDPRRIDMEMIRDLKRLFEFGGGISGPVRSPFDWGSVGGGGVSGGVGAEPPPEPPESREPFAPGPTEDIQGDVEDVVDQVREDIKEEGTGDLPPFPEEPPNP